MDRLWFLMFVSKLVFWAYFPLECNSYQNVSYPQRGFLQYPCFGGTAVPVSFSSTQDPTTLWHMFSLHRWTFIISRCVLWWSWFCLLHHEELMWRNTGEARGYWGYEIVKTVLTGSNVKCTISGVHRFDLKASLHPHLLLPCWDEVGGQFWCPCMLVTPAEVAAEEETEGFNGHHKPLRVAEVEPCPTLFLTMSPHNTLKLTEKRPKKQIFSISIFLFTQQHKASIPLLLFFFHQFFCFLIFWVAKQSISR